MAESPQYYILAPGGATPTGPLTVEQVNAMLAQHAINMDYMYCAVGSRSWDFLTSMPGIKGRGAAQVWTARSMDGKPLQVAYSGLAWSIVLTILCFTPLGIVAIVHSARVNSFNRKGDYAAAATASASAARWRNAAMLVSVLGYVLFGVCLAA